MIQNVSQFKKALKVGVELSAIYHREFNGRDADGKVIYKDKSLGVRKVSIVQTNSFALETTRTDGRVTDSWCSYPKASQSKFEDGKITIYEDDGLPVLTYEFV